MHESSTHRILQTLAIHVITDCLLPIDIRGRFAWLCSSRDSMSSSHRYSHVMYSSLIFSWVTCSIKSRCILSFALTNDAVRLNLLILYHLLVTLHWWWWCHRSNNVPYRMFEKSGHVTCILFGNIAFISNRIDDITANHMSWYVVTIVNRNLEIIRNYYLLI